VSQDPLSDSTRSTVMPWVLNQASAAKGIMQLAPSVTARLLESAAGGAGSSSGHEFVGLSGGDLTVLGVGREVDLHERHLLVELATHHRLHDRCERSTDVCGEAHRDTRAVQRPTLECIRLSRRTKDPLGSKAAEIAAVAG
jgi:hypothetical protein